MKETNFYICDKEKHIIDGLCNGKKPDCLNGGNCYITTIKEYAEEYVDIFKAKKWFEDQVIFYESRGDIEKSNQYKNALNGVNQAIYDIQQDTPEGIVVGYLLPQPEDGMEGMVCLFND